MADYVAISDTQVDPDAPLTSQLAYAWRDNPVAIAEGATGAPKIQTAALGTDTNMRDWVLARTAASSAGAVGTYAFLRNTSSSARNFGNTSSGSSLEPSNADGVNSASTVSGTWRCMGECEGVGGGSSNPSLVTLWLRIS